MSMLCELSDAEVINRVIKKDSAAFTEIYHRPVAR